jgi:hypothetical protein
MSPARRTERLAEDTDRGQRHQAGADNQYPLMADITGPRTSNSAGFAVAAA